MYIISQKGDLRMPILQISLEAARVNAKLTLEDVAKKCHKSKQTIINWEKGRSEISPADLFFLCSMYGIPSENIILPR